MERTAKQSTNGRSEVWVIDQQDNWCWLSQKYEYNLY